MNVLNVKLPFIEAIEHIKNDNEIKGAITDSGKVITIRNNKLIINELETNLNVDDILNEDWFVVFEKNTNGK